MLRKHRGKVSYWSNVDYLLFISDSELRVVAYNFLNNINFIYSICFLTTRKKIRKL